MYKSLISNCQTQITKRSLKLLLKSSQKQLLRMAYYKKNQSSVTYNYSIITVQG